jgi:hypothetical protein
MLILFIKAIIIFSLLFTIGWLNSRRKDYGATKLVKLPMKTMMVAGIMKTFGVLGALASGGILLLAPLTGAAPAFAGESFLLLIGLLAALSCFISGNLLSKGKKLGWLLSLIHLIILLIFVIFLILTEGYPFYLIIFIVAPLILLLTDRKNFWKIAF